MPWPPMIRTCDEAPPIRTAANMLQVWSIQPIKTMNAIVEGTLIPDSTTLSLSIIFKEIFYCPTTEKLAGD